MLDLVDVYNDTVCIERIQAVAKPVEFCRFKRAAILSDFMIGKSLSNLIDSDAVISTQEMTEVEVSF